MKHERWMRLQRESEALQVQEIKLMARAHARKVMDMPEERFIPAIPVDEIIHTDEHPFCWDIHCPCHWDRSYEGCIYRRDYIDSPLDEGLITRQEADRLYFDKQI